MSRGARHYLAAATIAACLLLQTGCAGYRVGPVLNADYKSAAVPMFKNKTLRPQLEAQITNAIIRQLQSDGTLRIDSQDAADIVVAGEIIDYQRTPLRSVRQETGVAREYRITITAQVDARDRRTGQAIFSAAKVAGSTDVFIGDDLQAAESQALPLIADELARNVVSLLVESW
jgi:hypothetical protein